MNGVFRKALSRGSIFCEVVKGCNALKKIIVINVAVNEFEKNTLKKIRQRIFNYSATKKNG